MGFSMKWWAFVGGVAAAALAAATHHGYDSARREPDFCVGCHTETAGLAGTKVRSHPSIDCQTCHPSGTSATLGLMLDRLRGNTDLEVTAHGEKRPEVCAGCHADTGPRIEQSAGHKAHLLGPKPTGCLDCHGESIHAGRPGNAGCVECHPKDKVTSSAMAEVHCLACHDYLGPQPDTGRRQGFGRCETCHGGTGGPDAAQGGRRATTIHLHGEMPCGTCHQPHREPFTVARACETCHEKVQHAHPEVEGREGAAYCTTCHGPHDDWSGAVERCQKCHEDQLLAALPTRATKLGPMGDELLDALAAQAVHVSCVDCHPAHTGEGPTAMRAATKNCPDCHAEVASPTTHRKSACNDCHAPHRPQPRECGDCHETLRDHGAESCQSCHRVHPTPTFNRPTCESCHREKLPAGATESAGGHPKSGCADCHTPHKAGVKACAACHEKQQTAVFGTPKEHARCEACHLPHEWKSKTCAECHEVQAKAVAPIEKHRDCAACHPSHQARGKTPDLLAACVGCHEKARDQAARKHRDCLECHEPHAGQRGAPAKKPDCRDCHKEKFAPPPGVPKHVDCKDCHQVHVAPGEEPPKCAKCHAPGSLKAGGALHVVKEHQACGDCHEAHGGVNASRANCLRCHEPQKKHEPKAAQCNGCHNFRAGGGTSPSSGPSGSPVGAPASTPEAPPGLAPSAPSAPSSL